MPISQPTTDPVGHGAGDRARRRSARSSTAARAGPPGRASSPARSAGTGSAGRSSRTSRSTSAVMPGWPSRRRGCGRSAAAASAPRRDAPRRRSRSSSATPRPIEASTPALGQPSGLPRMTPQTTASRPKLTSARPGRSSLSDGPRLSVRRNHASGSSTRPMGTLIQKIQCQLRPSAIAPPTSGSECDGEAADRTPGAECQATALGGDRGAEQGQRQRHDHRRAGALDGPGDDERLDAVGHRGGRRGGGEDREADDEHPPASPAVAEGGAGQQQRRRR